MNNFRKLQLLLLCALFVGLLFAACQNDDVNINDQDTELLTRNSPLTNLLERASMYDTTLDNAIDSTSCFSVKLPVQVEVNGQLVTLSSPSDYHLVADIFSQSPNADNYMGYQYPITVIYADYHEAVVNNRDELNSLRQECGVTLPGEPIYCFAISYPIQVFGYDSNFQLAHTYTVTNNTALFLLLYNLGANEFYAIDYPISIMINAVGELVPVNNNMELTAVLNTAIVNCSGTTPPCIPTNLNNGLIVYYSFGNGSLLDSKGGAHLTNTTTAHFAADRAGNLNCAYEFDAAAGTFLSATNTTALNGLTQMSVSLWYQPGIDQSEYELLIGRDTGMHCPDTNGQWSIGLYDLRRAVFGYRNSVWQVNGSQENSWYHVAATYNQVNNTIKIYTNGVLDDTATGIANCGTAGPPTVQDIGDLFIGQNFTGKIDDVAIYNRELNAAEVTQLYGLQPCCQ